MEARIIGSKEILTIPSIHQQCKQQHCNDSQCDSKCGESASAVFFMAVIGANANNRVGADFLHKYGIYLQPVAVAVAYAPYLLVHAVW